MERPKEDLLDGEAKCAEIWPGKLCGGKTAKPTLHIYTKHRIFMQARSLHKDRAFDLLARGLFFD